jgi:hypothetical protein
MSRSRLTPAHTRVVGSLAAAATMALASLLFAGVARAADPIKIEGESPAATNIATTVADPGASGGKYLALETQQDPPPAGWYATYEFNAQAGVYKLAIDATAISVGASYVDVSVNGGPFVQITNWLQGDFITADIATLGLDDVELRDGSNRITFRITERRIQPEPTVYRFSLDSILLTPTDVVLKDVFIGDKRSNLGTYGATESATLHLRLNGRTPQAQPVAYSVNDYFSNVVASGTVTVPSGASVGDVRLPGLAAGHYTANAWLTSTPDTKVTGYFARIPGRSPVSGSANRFGIETAASLGVPSSRMNAFVATMKQSGIGYLRDQMLWPTVEQEPGKYDMRWYERYAQIIANHGLKALHLWYDTPLFAMSETSEPLPADLRDAYRFSKHVAGNSRFPSGALEIWNEPETKSDRSTGDQHAAYDKAAALGINDARNHPLTAMPPTVVPGRFQNLVLQNDIVPYVDIWAFHGYPRHQPGALTPFPPQSGIENGLHHLYDADTQTWMTEAGIHIRMPIDNGCFIGCIPEDLSPAQQVDQARYLVQSTVQDLAAGTDKHFWFIGIPFQQGPSSLGMLSRDFQPLPAYSAQAAMTRILGKADFAKQVEGLPANVSAYVFNNDGQAITAVWADQPTPVDIPLPGRPVGAYDIMGKPKTVATGGGVAHVTASLDPIYLVSDGGWALHATPSANDTRATTGKLSSAKHIVLGQQFGVDNLAPVKNFRDPTQQIGYRMDPTTQMSVDVYNFNATPQLVSVSAHAYGGWSVQQPEQKVLVPAMGRKSVPFTINAGGEVVPGVDYPLVFEARLGKERISPSVSRIQLKTSGPAGEPVPLEPSITGIAPADGSTVGSRYVTLKATVADALSGIDRVRVEVDGKPVPSRFDADSGELSASLYLTPGKHEVWIGAYNKAHAPSEATVHVTVSAG